MDTLSLILIVIGALNWGLVGIFQFSGIRVFFGDGHHDFMDGCHQPRLEGGISPKPLNRLISIFEEFHEFCLPFVYFLTFCVFHLDEFFMLYLRS